MENKRFISNLPLIDIDWGEINNEHGDFGGDLAHGKLDLGHGSLDLGRVMAGVCHPSSWPSLVLRVWRGVHSSSQVFRAKANYSVVPPHLPLRIISWSDAPINSNQHRPVQSGHVYRRRLDFPVFPHAVAQSLGRKGE